MKKPDTLNEPEVLKHAAVRTKDGNILLGKCHADCFHQGANTGIEMSEKALDQGFMSSHGRYLNREEAFLVAVGAEQITGAGNGGVLGSEDLWSKQSGGKYKYDTVKGYYLG